MTPTGTTHDRTDPGDTAASTTRVAWRLLRNDPGAYGLAWSFWVAFHTFPVMIGGAVKVVLDRLTGDPIGTPWLLLGLVLGLEVSRWTLLVVAAVQWHGAYVGWSTAPRVNVLTSLVSGAGPVAGRLPGSPGEAVSRFRDDVQDVSLVLDVWLDISGSVIAALLALAIIATISPPAALAVLAPVTVALLGSMLLSNRLKYWRRRSREAAAAVTGFIGDTFGGILAVKTAGAESEVDRRFQELNEERAYASRRDMVLGEVVRSLGSGTGEVTVGLVLVMVASDLRSGTVSVGDIALFASYVNVIAGVPRWAGRLGAWHRQADVSIDRLAELTESGDRTDPVAPVRLHLREGPPRLLAPTTTRAPFHELSIDSLTVIHDSGRGIFDVSLTIGRGEFVAVTGEVGAGKSTLLRGMLGLVEATSGTISWNGVRVEPALDLVPPRVAYLPQVPRLFSETLSDTVLLGVDPTELDRALWLACLDRDLVRMEAGTETIVGPKGVRLSGGQIQRAGAARAFVRRPDVLVVDDLSSALDVDTERLLWQRLTETYDGCAVVAVTHRVGVLDMADEVVVLEDGRRIAG